MQAITIPSRLEFNGSRFGMPLVGHSGFDAFRQPLGLREHVHRCWELTYVFTGRATWELADGSTLTLAGGDMAVTQPGQPHRGRLDIIEPAAIFWTNLALAAGPATGSCWRPGDVRRLSRVLRAAGNTVRFAGDAINDDLVRLHDTLRSTDRSGAQARARALFCVIIESAVAVLAAECPRRDPGSYAETACAYIRSHLAEDLSIPAIAGHLGISASRLHALFRQKTGITPNDFLQRQRVDAAAERLAAGREPITSIGLRLGFSSSQYFATCFRKYTGMTPGDYRRSALSRATGHTA